MIGTPVLPKNSVLIREASFDKREHHMLYLRIRICVLSKRGVLSRVSPLRQALLYFLFEPITRKHLHYKLFLGEAMQLVFSRYMDILLYSGSVSLPVGTDSEPLPWSSNFCKTPGSHGTMPGIQTKHCWHHEYSLANNAVHNIHKLQ